MNRVAWDLRYEPSHEVKLRTTPPGNPHVWEEKRFKGKDWRPIDYYGINETRRGPLVAPGTYTVKLTVDGKTFTRPVKVLKDPNSAGTEADVAAATTLWVDIYHDVNTVADMINQIEWTRKQIEDLHTELAGDRARADIVTSATELDAKLQAVEDTLMQKTLAEGDLKSFRGAIQLYLKFLWLTAEVGAGAADVSGNADMAPTAARARGVPGARRSTEGRAGRVPPALRPGDSGVQQPVEGQRRGARDRDAAVTSLVVEPVRELDQEDVVGRDGEDVAGVPAEAEVAAARRRSRAPAARRRRASSPACIPSAARSWCGTTSR